MKPDDNWAETRILAEDLDTLLGIPKGVSEDYLKVLENLIVHRLVEQVREEKDFRGKDCQIELPYLGSLIISIDNKNKISTNFVVRDTFYRKIRKAFHTKESPLVSQCSKILGEDLLNKFEGEV